ncbi:protein pelota homolog [Tachyglossus aculeatus]|uniref:protein pelota homolog n=1 Tax=Tachyglossus aculeatus TaxID=9261 RepID=UPI0018F5EEE6|nr:protein pelota homolog [Tachyglossus aculeatus]
MKLVSKTLEKDSSGEVTLVPEEAEDLWHAYNLVQAGDRLRAATFRKVQPESSTGSVGGSRRVRTTLTLCVSAVELEPGSRRLRVGGPTAEENAWVRLGAYHTLELAPHRPFTLAKAGWDSVALARVERACRPGWAGAAEAAAAAVLLQEGLATVCLLTPAMTLTRARVEAAVPRKRRGRAAQHQRALDRFLDLAGAALLRHVPLAAVKCVLVGSPGFLRERFCRRLFQKALRDGDRNVLDNRDKFLQVHTSSGHKYSLKEVLCDPVVLSRMSDTKAAGEVKALDDFYKMLQHEPDRAFYGVKQVEKANEILAIDVLLISDALFRHQDVATRSRYVRLVDSVQENAGTVHIFSSLHVSGEQLGKLTGVAAILRFPVPDLSDEEDSSSSSGED